METVVVGMSGGVDSSVTALLLKQAGYDVIGVNLRLWTPPDDGLTTHDEGRCCSIEAMNDARAVCDALDVPFMALNMEREFGERVVDYFTGEYAAGRTPNPCLACNRHIKFDALLRRARAIGARYLATGHYARVVHRDDGQHELWQARALDKDQSYALYDLTPDQLSALLFPLGELPGKAETRALAREHGLPVAEKPDSQEICFIPRQSHAAFVGRLRPEALTAGPIEDLNGRRLGEHRGLAHFTVGQRRGIGLAGPEPLFVVQVDAARNAVVVGPAAALRFAALEATRVNWVAGTPPAAGQVLEAVVRYRGPRWSARVWPEPGGTLRVEFITAQPTAVAPGQAVVLYDGQRVVGGGLIARTERSEAVA